MPRDTKETAATALGRPTEGLVGAEDCGDPGLKHASPGLDERRVRVGNLLRREYDRGGGWELVLGGNIFVQREQL